MTRPTIDGQLGQNPANQGSELEPVSASDGHKRCRNTGDLIEDKVSVRGQRVKTGPGVDDRPQGGWKIPAEELLNPLECRHVGLEVSALRRHLTPAGIL